MNYNCIPDGDPVPLWPSLGSHRFAKSKSLSSLVKENNEETKCLPNLPNAERTLDAKGLKSLVALKLPRQGGLGASLSSPTLSEASMFSLIDPDGKHARLYAARMQKTKDANSSSMNRTLRAAYNSKMPQLLVHEEASSRLGAVNRLGKMKLEGGPHAGLVVARLEDDDPRVRRRALWALKEMTARQLEPHKAIIGQRLKHRSPEVRALAAELLSFMGKLALDIMCTNAYLLENCLKDEYVMVRQAAADAFFKWGTVTPAACAGALAGALGDSDPLVRKLACLSLGQLGAGAQKYDAQVAALLLDPDKAVRLVAQPSLQRIRGK